MYRRLEEYRDNESTTCKIYKSDYLKFKHYITGGAITVCFFAFLILLGSCGAVGALTNNLPELPANSTTSIHDLRGEFTDKCIVSHLYFPFLSFIGCFALPIIRCFIVPDVDSNFLNKYRERILLYKITLVGLETKTDWGYFLTQDKLYDPRLLCYVNDFITPRIDIDIHE